jgi:hypothetical protein
MSVQEKNVYDRAGTDDGTSGQHVLRKHFVQKRKKNK